jgi:glycosyltransferase involved in cell wall biosynthesis
MTSLGINGRFRRGPQTGVQRVASELIARLGVKAVEYVPVRHATGMRGHLWEQTMLPLLSHDKPLWSPCNTGPLAVREQVVTFHDAVVFDHPEWFSRAFVQTYRLLWPRLARRVRRVVTVSEYSRRRLAEALDIPPGNIDVVPNGVSSRFCVSTAEQISSVATQYGVQPQRYFVTLSTIEPRKNLPLVLRAWQSARARLPEDVQLLLLGSGGATHIFSGNGEEEISGNGVLRAGFVPDADLPALLGGACALLYPSRYEGFGLPILEAMACGTPSVTTALTSLPEVGGSAAIYVDADDPADLARQMISLWSEPSLRQELSEASLERARLFSWDAAARGMDDILRCHLGL